MLDLKFKEVDRQYLIISKDKKAKIYSFIKKIFAYVHNKINYICISLLT